MSFTSVIFYKILKCKSSNNIKELLCIMGSFYNEYPSYNINVI